MAKHWFVFYTKSRHEKKVKELLEKSGYEVFLPVHKVVRQWSDRRKRVEVPLFNSYIFVNEEEHNIPEVLKIAGMAWNIKSNGKPAVLRLEELNMIKRFIASGLFLEVSPATPNDFKSGDRAKVIDGPLSGMVGTISGLTDEGRLSFLMEGINQVIRVTIPAVLLKKC